MRPQLQAAGADAEDAGEKLIRCKELWDVKILGQVWELFAQISRFLGERHKALVRRRLETLQIKTNKVFKLC